MTRNKLISQIHLCTINPLRWDFLSLAALSSSLHYIGNRETLQLVLGLTRGLLPVGDAQNTSPSRSYPNKMAKLVHWLISVWVSSSSCILPYLEGRAQRPFRES